MSGRWFDLTPWTPDKDFLLGPLGVPRQHRLRLDHFPVGIDNVHLDVFLAPDLSSTARSLVRAVLREDMHRFFWREPLKAPDIAAAEAFRSTHTAVTQAVLEQGNAETRLARAQLYQLAVLKLLLGLVDRELRELRKELEQTRDRDAARARPRAMTTHERLVVLAKSEPAVRYRTASHVSRILGRIEIGTLSKRRRALIGVAWPLPERVLLNPLLQLGGLGSDDDFASVYPLWLKDVTACSRVNEIALQLLAPWLPEQVRAPGIAPAAEEGHAPDPPGVRGLAAVAERLQRVATPQEYQPPRLSWLDQWENLVALLGGDAPGWPHAGPWHHRRWRAFQLRLVKQLYARLDAAGLLPALAAADALAELQQGLAMGGLTRPLFEVLAGRLDRRDLARRLDGLFGRKDAAELLRRVDAAQRALRQRSRTQRLQLVVRALGHWARFRSDLKTAWQALHAMDELRLTDDPEELVLSRANGLLQEFHGPGVALPEVRPVVGHVILKADVRGSTRLTAQMLQADLNPAAYFSRNLFNPINRLRRAYGAEKVFIEGDAVILAILEHPGESGLAVARACGLARKILQVMDAQNGRNRRLGLPELELGLGIAYVDQPPAYLFDEGQRITISPAINRADRLSSCHGVLRRAALRPEGRGVEVVVVQEPQQALKSDGENLLRYNVNGIELDAPAFFKLRAELNLRGLKRAPREAERYYAGRYADARGEMHWLVVREAPIRPWRNGELAAPERGQRRFYEVVTDRALLRQVCGLALAAQRAAATPLVSPVG